MVETLAEHSIEEASLSKRPTPKHKFEGHEEVIQDFVFLHNNAHVVSGSRDGTMRKWNCNTGNMVGQPWKEKGGSVYALALSPNGKTIACGREDGSVQRWKTDGKMFKDVWTRHTNVVRSLSWSPSGRHIASGSYDGKILIQKAESGEIEVGPIETKQGGVRVVAYSPAGDRILSGGWNSTVCVLDGKTGEVLVGPNKIPGIWVTSLVWSSDGSKFYSTSDKFARIFDNSGNELRCFEHDDWLFSIALSPKYDVLACVGWSGIVQLWDTKSDQPLGSQPFGLEDRTCSVNVTCVSFSRDGRFLAYGGADKTITLWTMKEILGTEQGAQHVHTETQSQSLSCLDFDATKPLARSWGDGITEGGHDDPYSNFFQGSKPYLPETSSVRPQFPYLSSARHFWNVLITSRHLPQGNKSISQEHPKRSFFAHRSHSNSPMQPATTTTNQLSPEVNSQGEQTKERDQDINLVDQKEPPADAHTAPPDISASLAKFKSKENSRLWNVLARARGKAGKRVLLKTHSSSPEVVEVYAVRGFQRLVVTKRTHKKQSRVVTHCAPPAVASILLQAGPSRGSTTQACTSSQAIPRQSEFSSQSISQHGNQISCAPGGLSPHTSPPRSVTTYHTDGSDLSIQGSCNKFLDKICFPRGHYHNDS